MKETTVPLEQNKPGFMYSLVTGFTCVHVFSPESIGFNSRDIFDLQNHIGRRLPGGLILTDETSKFSQYPGVDLFLENKPEASLEMFDSKHFRLSGPFQKKEFSSRLPYIAYNLAERSRQEVLHMSSLHAAAVSTKDGRSLLILGDKGSGKTLLSLVFGLYYDLGLIGNDLVLVEGQPAGLFIRAGTQIFDVRQAVIKYYLPQLGIQHLSEGNPYEEKITLIPEEIGIVIGQDTQGLSAVIRINLHPFNDKTTIEKGARRIQEVLRLRENFARYIRGVVTPLILDKKLIGGSFPSMDSEELVKQRDEAIEAIMSTNFIYAYGNNPKDVANEIINAVL